MKLLLDTHVLLWTLEGDQTLSAAFRRELRASPRPQIVVSAASLWEIAIKVAKGKLRAPADLPTRLARAGLHVLPVTAAHAWAARRALPLATADPFDRLLYTQAKLERLTLATRDAKLLASDISVIPV